jgi:hypothetical protein
MITTQTIEQRVTHLEAELERISRLVSIAPTPPQTTPEPDWIDRLAGSITNETLFLEALEYGKQHRKDS